ncbi:MAG: SRPBCC family protein [Nitriliruptor sp.]|uniref:SRPBCC family protein n=1 Tax=Nitriliruptor sp. TaxID=2448056 RepID=UPI0034A052B9
MEFVNEFTVPVGVDRAFEILTDLERVAPCLPGATLEEVHGDAYTGKVKVKVGPIAVTYRGTAELTEKDQEAKHAVIHAAGKEARGAGTATADVTADLVAETDDTTRVKVVTDLTITGKPAQFGRGVMGEVGTKLIDTFADRLSTMIAEDVGGTAGGLPPATDAPAADARPASGAAAAAPGIAAVAGAAATTSAAATTDEVSPPAPADGPRRIAPPAQEPEALDLVEVAGGAVAKRLVPLVAVAAAIVVLLWWRRRR